jgi:hypothetical protein
LCRKRSEKFSRNKWKLNATIMRNYIPTFLAPK